MRPVAFEDLAAGVALQLVSATQPVVAADRQEPAADPLGRRQRLPDVLDRRVVGSLEADDPPFTVAERTSADASLGGCEFPFDVDHAMGPSFDVSDAERGEAAFSLAAREFGAE